jgi:hypothetical protein
MLLLERHAQEERTASTGDWLFVLFTVTLIIVVALVPFVIVGWLVGEVLRLFL